MIVRRPVAHGSGTLSLLVAALVTAAPPAFAKILKTRPSASSTWSSVLPLTVGSGFEIESDSEQTQYDFPFLLEYNFTEWLKLSVEPNVVYIESKTPGGRWVTGFGDLETTLEYEFISERRYRPAFTAEGSIKWPTATDADIGNPGTDYSLGLILSKDLVFVDLDLNALYTFIGDSQAENNVEVSLGAEFPITYFLTLEAEVVSTIGVGGAGQQAGSPNGGGSTTGALLGRAIRAVRGQPGTIAGLGAPTTGTETEGTLGLAEQVSKHLKFEEGVIRKSDQSWQFVFAWEWSFSGED